MQEEKEEWGLPTPPESNDLKSNFEHEHSERDRSVRLKGLREHAQHALVQLINNETAVVNVFGLNVEIKKEDFETACGEGIAEFTKLIDKSKAKLEAARVPSKRVAVRQ